MDLARAAKFGTIGGIGAILVLLGTAGLSWVAWSNRISGYEGRAMGTIMIALVKQVVDSDTNVRPVAVASPIQPLTTVD